MDRIYEMRLHEETMACNFLIIRVASGWIYYRWRDNSQDYSDVGTFVPFDDNFEDKDLECPSTLKQLERVPEEPAPKLVY